MEEKEMLVYPCAYDCLSAKLIERAGFKAIGTTGYGMEASILGKPDVGLLTLTEVVTMVRNIARTVKAPVIVDAEGGYGNAINVTRTVKELESAGAAGCFIQDQVVPGRCASMAGKEVIPMDEMIRKIKAALDSRDDPDFLIGARTDAEIISVEEAAKRMNAYLKAGADAVKPMPHNRAEFEAFAKLVKGPLWTLYVATPTEMKKYVKGPEEMTFDDIERMGYRAMSVPTAPLFAAAKGMMDLLEELKTKKTFRHYQERVKPPTREEFWQILGRDEFMEMEKKYLTEK